MWDEKKFFQDFVQESEKVKPDDEFVEQLKGMMKEENVIQSKKRNNVYFMRYAAVVAAAMLCLVVGTVVWKGFDGNSKTISNDKEDYTVNIHVGQDSEIQSGIIGNSNSELEEAIAIVQDEKIVIKDEDGENISSAKRKQLLSQLNRAEKVENEDDLEDLQMSDDECDMYICEGEEDLEIKIYEDEYILIGDSDSIYQVK